MKVTAVVLCAWVLCAGGVLPSVIPQAGLIKRSPNSPVEEQPVMEPTPNVEFSADTQQGKAGNAPPDLASLVPGFVPSLMNNTLFNERGTMVMGGFSVMFMPMPAGADMANMFQNGFSMFSSLPGVPGLPALPGAGRRR